MRYIRGHGTLKKYKMVGNSDTNLRNCNILEEFYSELVDDWCSTFLSHIRGKRVLTGQSAIVPDNAFNPS